MVRTDLLRRRDASTARVERRVRSAGVPPEPTSVPYTPGTPGSKWIEVVSKPKGDDASRAHSGGGGGVAERNRGVDGIKNGSRRRRRCGRARLDVPRADARRRDDRVASSTFDRSRGHSRGARGGLPGAGPVPRRVTRRGSPDGRRVRAPRSALPRGSNRGHADGCTRGGGVDVRIRWPGERDWRHRRGGASAKRELRCFRTAGCVARGP